MESFSYYRVEKSVLIRMIHNSTECGEYEKSYDRLMWNSQGRQNVPSNLMDSMLPWRLESFKGFPEEMLESKVLIRILY